MRDYAKTIAHLIANAEDETLPAAARANYRAKAESMMREYRVAEEEAIATEGVATVPVLDKIVIMESRALHNPLRNQYWTMWSQIAKHCGIRIEGKYVYAEDGESRLEASAVGYEGDIRYAELLYTAARLVFLTRIDARVNTSLTDQQNCYFMRNSGMKRNEIARALWGSAPDDGAAHGKVQKLYLAECASREETPRVSGRGIQVDIYREAYANSFVNELGWRLHAASDAVDSAEGGLVLHGRKERVDEAFYNEFPHRRPMTDEERAAREAAWEAEEADCEPCAKTKSKSGKCSRHRPTHLSAADLRKYERLHHSPEAQAGGRSGRAAAKEVHIGRQTEKTTRATGSPERTALGS